jgi:hypothetical protein
MIKMKKELIQRTVKAVRAIRMISLKNNHKTKVNRKENIHLRVVKPIEHKLKTSIYWSYPAILFVG